MTTTSVLRRFNRTYTQRIGVLEESFLGTGRPLAVSRLLFEIGAGDGDAPGTSDVTVRELRERLDLDSGHLSRMLRRLEADGLVATSPDPADQRRRVVRLTDAGRTARQELDDRSEELAARIVAPLTDRQRERLTAALATADLLVRAATVRLREVPPEDPLGRSALEHYLAEIDARFPTGYVPGGPVGTEPGSTYVLATSDGEPVAYGGLRPAPAVDERAIEIKRMWVHADWRGAGLGSRMLRHLEQLAGEQGATRVVLDTNGVLEEAIAMYERAGYRAVDRYPGSDPHATHFFEKRLSSPA